MSITATGSSTKPPLPPLIPATARTTIKITPVATSPRQPPVISPTASQLTTTLPTPAQTTTPIPAVEQFTVNFTITNLKYREEMGMHNSKIFNATESDLVRLLDRILLNSSIGPAYLRCRVTQLRPVRDGDETGMDAICTYRNDSTTPAFDRVKVYHEIVNQTNGFTEMGQYYLERYSLYVNGYHETPPETTTLPTPAQTTTPIPAVEQFTVNFTITNLKYREEMGMHNSKIFNATESDLLRLLDRILLNSSIGPAYLRCRVTQLRPVRDGDETGMDAVCTYRNDSTTPAFDRVKVYHEIVNQTNGFTEMGQYYLERYSLYVNGYHEDPPETTTLPTPAQTTTPIPAVEQFTVNFTVTNLKYREEMGQPNSTVFNTTERALIAVLGRFLSNSSIGPAYLGCRVTQLRPVKNGDETGMDAVCTYRNDSTSPAFDRVKVYHEIVNQTDNFSKMGPYEVERYSLYVNGYHEDPPETTTLPTPAQTTTPIPGVEQFTVNFTVTNLKYREEMGQPNSTVFNTTERALIAVLGRFLSNSSIGPAYLGCRVTQLRPVKNGDETGMDAVCTYRNDSTSPAFDRVKVYHEIVNQTDNFSKMGPYEVERYSLYVNGYHEDPPETTTLPMPTQTPTPTPTHEHFTINCTITNLRYKPEMGTPNSKAFNATEKALTMLFGRILRNSSIGPAYLGCEVTQLRPVSNGDETGMDAVCTYRNDSTTPAFDRVKVYHEIVNQTSGFTKMGPYNMERYSLYVNGYHEVPAESTPPPAPTPTPALAVEPFTVNWTVTNLKYNPEMGTPNSKAFNATEKALTTLLGRILRNSSIGPAYVGCKVTQLRPVSDGDETGMDAVCTYRDSTTPTFDRVKVYHEIVNQTSGFTKMGPYSMERYSLYVNGYHEVPVASTTLPTPTQTPTPVPTLERFTLNCTVTNLRYKPEMGTPNSKAFNATEKALTMLFGRILRQSSIGPAYLGCEVTQLRPVRDGDETGMDAVCTYRNDSTTPAFDRVKVYHEIVNETSGFTKMGPYSMERYSLYVNGYHEVPVEPTPPPAPTPTPALAVEPFTVNWTVTNLRYNPEMGTPNSKAFNATEKALTTLLGRILRNSSIGPAYVGCKVTQLRPVSDGDETGMDAVCTYRNDSTTPTFDRVKVYHEIVNQTSGFTKMGPYSMERYSLYVNGYNEVPVASTTLPTPTQTPTPVPTLEHFTLNCTVTNLRYKPEMGTPNSKAFNATEKALTMLFGRILRQSSIGPAYLGCEVTQLRPVRDGDETGMDAVCTYRNDSTTPAFDRVKVYHEIVNQTSGFTKMGPYSMERYSLYVNGYYEVPVEPTPPPALTPTPALAVEPFTVNWTVTNLKYNPEMGTPNSKAFNATEKALTTLLGRILRSSSIGPAYVGCKVTQLRPVSDGDETGMDAVCTYRNDSTTPTFDRVKVYHEIVNQTSGFTKMGPYNMERYSLYVNGYREVPVASTTVPMPTQTPTPVPTLEHFTLNCTVTNLRYKPEMGTPNSKAFNATEKALTMLFGRILRNSSIGPAYLGCEVTQLRPVRDGDETGMDAVCTYRNDSTTPAFDRVKVYHEIINQTSGFTKMGPYSMERYSLYVNGYNEQPRETTVLPPVPTKAPTPTPPLVVERFTVNCTVTNLRYKPEMGTPNSKAFNSTEKALTTLLGRIFSVGSIGPEYSGCKVTALKPVRGGDETGMDTVCTYRNDSTTPAFDRVKVYHEIVNRTSGFTKMGPYSMERYSLYVNGYNEQPLKPTVSPLVTKAPTPTPAPAVERFTMNCTVTNLRYKPEMGTPNSKAFNSTEKALTTLFGRVLRSSSIGPAYMGCKVSTLRPVQNGDETGMDAVCSYRNSSAAPAFDRVNVYHEIVNRTSGFTKMGPYDLERHSLYVNGYHEVPVEPSTTQPPPARAIEHFTVNYTVTNLKYKSEMGILHSKVFNATEKALTTVLGRVISSGSAVGPNYQGCQVTALRPLRDGDETAMDAVCEYRAPSPSSPFDRVTVYHEIVNKTNGFTKMGPYNLSTNSLYVNGYNEASLPTGEVGGGHTWGKAVISQIISLTAASPTTPRPPTAVDHFTVNYTVTNLIYKPEMGTPQSKVFNATEKALSALMGRAVQTSSVGPALMGCNVSEFRSIDDGKNTGVDSVCSYQRDLMASPFDRVQMYREIANKTMDFTKMGPYDLDRDSLLVNGYHEPSRQPDLVPTPPHPPASERFTTNFTLTNLRYKAEMGDPSSKAFTSTQRVVTTLLGQMLRESSVGDAYSGCNVTALRSSNGGTATAVDTVCSYQRDVMAPQFDRVKVYQELINMTNGFTKMGPYTLDKDSLYVNGYSDLRSIPHLPAAIPAKMPTLRNFTVNYTLSSLPYMNDMGTPGSRKFNATEKALNFYMEPLLKKTHVGPAFAYCRVERFWAPQTRHAAAVDTVCSYWEDLLPVPFDHVRLHREISNLTRDGTRLGHYSLEKDSLSVNGYLPVVRGGEEGVGYELGFTVVNQNLTHTDPSSPEYQRVKSAIAYELNQLFLRSAIRNGFNICKVTGLRHGSIVVDCKCYFDPATNTSQELVRETFQQETRNATSLWLGRQFQLKGVTVRAPESAIESATAALPPQLQMKNFAVNFTVTNLPYAGEMADPDSDVYWKTKMSLESELHQLYQRSSLQREFVQCSVESFRPTGQQTETGVDAACAFAMDSSTRTFDRALVYDVFRNWTGNATALGMYTLDNGSLLVSGYPSTVTPVHHQRGLPFWAIILICLSALLGFLLLFLICFLVAFCLRKKAGKYQVQQDILGLYFPHLDMRKAR
uniref:LOW QUALITY PROTEIN: mucin-16 n=1 Tax=Podarcis muralis TaxID=64176 RepID=UPI0010A00D25|nr:LOW QUALITY PROTEIN: mucin-16 [Podarcis muralis]